MLESFTYVFRQDLTALSRRPFLDCIMSALAMLWTFSIAFQPSSAANQPPPAPAFYPASGKLTAPSQIAVGPIRGCAVIKFTTDGTMPNLSSQTYSRPIWVNHTQTIRAVIFADGMQSVASQTTYTLDPNTYPAPSHSDTTPPTINLELPTATQ